MSSMGKNLLMFEFEGEDGAMRASREGPWSIIGGTMILKR